MNKPTVINAIPRETTGKVANKKLKAAGYIPAVVYGHNYAPVKVSVSAADFNHLFRSGSENAEAYRLFKLTIDTGGKPRETVVVTKEIQRHPVQSRIQHVDFFAVRMDEEMVAPVHIRLHGKPAGVKAGGILRHILREIEVKSLPTEIPPHFDVDVTALQIGDSLHVSDIQIPENVQVLADPATAIVNIMAPTVQKDEEAEGEAAAAEGDEQSDDKKDASPEDKEAKE